MSKFSAMTVSLPLPFIDRFALIISGLHAAVAARIRCPPVTAEIIVLICARLRRIGREFERLAAQIRAGTYVARPVGLRRARGVGSRRGVSIVWLHWTLWLPPWQPAWLHRVAPGDAGAWAGALRDMLYNPEFAAVVSAVPRMRRLLQPLCFMLGVESSLLKPRAPVPAAAIEVAVAVADVGPAIGGVVASAGVTVAEGSGTSVAARRDAEAGGVVFETT
jgi:hypothetical protein